MTYNLITEKWIPVAPRDGGEARWIRPAEIAEAGNVEFAWGRADLTIASYELLIGLLSVVYPPASDDQWRERLRKPPAVKDFEDALAPLIPWFNLDGDGPRFMQDLEDFEGDELTTDVLFMDAPGANTLKNGGDLFVKSGRFTSLSMAEAAIALYALQSFAPSGGAGHRTSLRGGGPLTTLIRGDANQSATLWFQLWANVSRSRIQIEPLLNDWSNEIQAARVFPWCAPTPTSENKKTFRIGEGHPLQACFSMPRRIRLKFSGISSNASDGGTDAHADKEEPLVTGFKMKSYGINYDESWNAPGWRHPLTPYYTPKTAKDGTELPVHPKTSRLGYRQWAGLVFTREVQSEKTGAGRGIARNIDYFKRRESMSLNILAAGYVMDNMKVVDFLEAEFPLIVAENSEVNHMLEAAAFDFVEAADTAASALRTALGKALDAAAGKTVLEGPVNEFWAATENQFRQSLRALAAMPDENALDAKLVDTAKAWLRCLGRECLTVYDRAVPPETLLNKRPGEQERLINARQKLLATLGGKKIYAIFGLEPPSKAKNKREAAA